MDIAYVFVLLLCGVLAGIVTSLAGGGLLLIYPVLLGLGIPPVSASATGSVALLPALISSEYGYRKLLLKVPGRYYLLLAPASIGTLIGAWLLAHTANRTFENIVPWFVLFATGLIIFQSKLHQWLHARRVKALEQRYHRSVFVLVFFVMLLLTVYGGYFGAGIGIILLAFFGLAELTDIGQINAMKNMFGVVINCTSFIYFSRTGLIDWHAVPALVIGSTVGGYAGSLYTASLPRRTVRGIIIAIALSVSIYLFVR